MTSWVHKIPQKPIVTVEGAESGIKSAEGRNVYYSDSDLLALTVMEYLLSIGLSFEVCQHVLGILKARESWMFDQSVAKEEMKRLMLVPDSQEQLRELVEFDRGLAMETIDRGSPVVPFWSDGR